MKLEVGGEQKDNEMFFIGLNEREFLELQDVHEELFKEDESN